MDPVCRDLEKELYFCYRKNPEETLRCHDEVLCFKQCVLDAQTVIVVFFSLPISVHDWTSGFLIDVHGLCGAIEGRMNHLYHAGSGWVGRVWSAREKSLEMLPHGWELNSGHREDSQWLGPPFFYRGVVIRTQSCYQLGVRAMQKAHTRKGLKIFPNCMSYPDPSTSLRLKRVHALV